MYRSRAYPNGCSAVATRRARRPPINSSTWLVESATECTPSANIADEPVMAAATNLLTPIPKFAANAVRTALVLSSPATAACPPSSPSPSTLEAQPPSASQAPPAAPQRPRHGNQIDASHDHHQ